MTHCLRQSIVTFACTALLAACGGDDSTPTQANLEGAFEGSLSGGTATSFQLLVLPNQQSWTLYGDSMGSTLLVAGFIQGSGNSSSGSYTTSNALDFGFAPPVPVSVSASYSSTSVSGTASEAGVAISFSGAPIPASTYNYNQTASLADVQGSWSLTSLLGGSPASVAISPNGSFTGLSAGCQFSGTLVPDVSGKNFFNLSLAFGPAPCLLPGQTATGIGLTNILAGTTIRQLLIAGVTANRSAGEAFVGTR
jgi:hypothetical protein